jgi:hypothetical protein
MRQIFIIRNFSHGRRRAAASCLLLQPHTACVPTYIQTLRQALSISGYMSTRFADRLMLWYQNDHMGVTLLMGQRLTCSHYRCNIIVSNSWPLFENDQVWNLENTSRKCTRSWGFSRELVSSTASNANALNAYGTLG